MAFASKESHPEKRKGRAVLTTRDPNNPIDRVLAGVTIKLDGPDIENARRFGNALLIARNVWADRERCGRRYSEAGAGPLIRKSQGGRHD